MRAKSPKDLWAGLLFIGFGLFFVILARNYRMGNATNMGPGYFPTMVGGLVVGMGLVVVLQSFRVQGEALAKFAIRPVVLVTIALLVFGSVIKVTGLLVALMLLVVIAAFAGHEFKVKETLVLAVVLSVLSALVFVKGLGLSFPLWPMFLE